MGDLTKDIDELFVWSENPRHSDMIEENISENEIINILINAVGYSNMFNLAKDILENQLMGNLRPVVVKKNDRLLVYDGNRRISSIKLLLNPEIINEDNTVLKDKIVELINNTENIETILSELRSINVYESTEQEAYEIMDKTHGGSRNGVGTLPWDSFQKDKANDKRGISTIYPNAFKVVTKLGLRKNDIKNDYTSFERIFGNAKFKELFKITDYSLIDISYLRQLYDLLQSYKKTIKQNLGFSRIFNKSSEESGAFYNWAKPQLDPAANYIITFKCNISIYKGQPLPQDSLNYSIINFDGSSINIDQSQLNLKFITPTGDIQDSINTNISGQWKYLVKYKKSENLLLIDVKELTDPILTLKQNKIIKQQGEAITNLKDNILISTNSIDIDVKEKVQVFSASALITNNSFLSNNNIGEYPILYKYIDEFNSKEATATLIVEIVSTTQAILVEVDSINELLTFDGPNNFREYFNRLGYRIRALISQINKLDVSEYLYVLASALRVVIHLLEEEYCNKTKQTPAKKLHTKLSKLLNALTDDFKNNHVIYGKQNTVNEQILLDNFRALNSSNQWLIDVLNCGSHSGASVLSEIEVRSAGQKVSQILTYIAILLN